MLRKYLLPCLRKNKTKELLEELQIRSPLPHDMPILALYCGLRFGEIASLTWQDIDFGNEDIYIRDPKAGVNRKTFFINQVREMLKRRHAKPHASAERLFSTINEGKLVQVSTTFRRIAAEMFNEEVAGPRQRVCFNLHHGMSSIERSYTPVRSSWGAVALK
ncbi:tyrosine-type recombinase/integrase [Maridesulfovibrio frigidus]|uniref:tyrosine-type recombinase/integrase n=1 Tax=Maridesulfovibrio frigidus TaxID=340956 RepID=UPI0004E0E11E|nr:tyrosine-type recombinase/integrase [Maridesulfovibrio frigidus]